MSYEVFVHHHAYHYKYFSNKNTENITLNVELLLHYFFVGKFVCMPELRGWHTPNHFKYVDVHNKGVTPLPLSPPLHTF
jgi:hypothetical protein